METNPEYLEEVNSSIPEKQRMVFLMSRIDKCPNKGVVSKQ